MFKTLTINNSSSLLVNERTQLDSQNPQTSDSQPSDNGYRKVGHSTSGDLTVNIGKSDSKSQKTFEMRNVMLNKIC